MVARSQAHVGVRRLRTAVVAVAAVVLAGCWPAPGQGPNRNAHNPFVGTIRADTVDGLTELWTAATGDAAPGGVGPPIISDSDDGRLVHVTTPSSLYGFDLATGAERWSNSPPGTLDSDLYFMTSNGLDLLVVSSAFGNELWEAGQYDPTTGDGGPIEPFGRIDAVRTPSSGGLLVAFSQFRLIDPVDEQIRQSLQIFPGGISGALTDEPGEARLTLSTEQVFHAGSGLMTDEPGDGTHSNGLRAFPIQGGTNDCGPDDVRFACPQWVTPLDGTTATTPVLSSDGTAVYVGTDAGTVYAVDAATGTPLWSAAVGAAVTDSPALAEGTLYAPTDDGKLVALAADGCGAAMCEPLWSSPGGSALTVQPAVGKDVVFTGAADGSLRAYDAAGCGATECQPLWSTTTGSRITGDPALAYGKLFVGTEDGRLVAYGLPS